MCAVSNVMDSGRRMWPNHPRDWAALPYPLPADRTGEFVPASAGQLPSKEELEEFRKLLEQASKFDKITNQPDCEDPKKVAWLKEFCTRLRGVSTELATMADELEKTLEA